MESVEYIQINRVEWHKARERLEKMNMRDVVFDIGLGFDMFCMNQSKNNDYYQFKIIDKQKFFLARISYGI